jgi:hypothetical protein
VMFFSDVILVALFAVDMFTHVDLAPDSIPLLPLLCSDARMDMAITLLLNNAGIG